MYMYMYMCVQTIYHMYIMNTMCTPCGLLLYYLHAQSKVARILTPTNAILQFDLAL